MHDNDPLIGKMLAGFRLERVLGRGGMATVYYGWDTQLERSVAVKVINAGHQSEGTSAERFVKEARLIAAWRHPNILQIYFAGEDAGLYYYVMEYIEGSDLGSCFDDYRRQKKSMPVEEVLRIGRAVANALGYAHERGVVHRDVKPTNVLVTRGGTPKLLDFGIAVHADGGEPGGEEERPMTPPYASPEQLLGREITPLSDVYSLGVLLFRLLTGQLPYGEEARGPREMARLLDERSPPRPSGVVPEHELRRLLAGGLDAIVLKALAHRPDHRHASADALAGSLRTWLGAAS